MIHLIVAIDRDNAIGRNGDLIYHIREDLRNFRRLTVGNTVIMGRRTFESLPKGALPDRRNIVVTSNSAFNAPGADLASDLDQALRMAADGPGETFIIGGASIYRQALPLAQVLHITEIDAQTPDADTFFPFLDRNQYTLTDDQPLTDLARVRTYIKK